jgi:hypothetical protein
LYPPSLSLPNGPTLVLENLLLETSRKAQQSSILLKRSKMEKIACPKNGSQVTEIIVTIVCTGVSAHYLFSVFIFHKADLKTMVYIENGPEKIYSIRRYSSNSKENLFYFSSCLSDYSVIKSIKFTLLYNYD